MDKSKYMREWWDRNPDRRREYERARAAKRTPEEKAKLSEYGKAYRLKNKEAVKQKDKAKYLRRRAILLAQSRNNRKNNPAYALWKSAKERCKKSGMGFDITVKDIIVPDLCPVLGIKLFIDKGLTANSPSLDRIDPTKGYVKGNICVISHRANRIKTDATLEELRLVYAYVARSMGEYQIEEAINRLSLEP